MKARFVPHRLIEDSWSIDLRNSNCCGEQTKSDFIRQEEDVTVSLHDDEDNVITEVRCEKCHERVDPKDCTYLLGHSHFWWVCNNCQIRVK